MNLHQINKLPKEVPHSTERWETTQPKLIQPMSYSTNIARSFFFTHQPWREQEISFNELSTCQDKDE